MGSLPFSIKYCNILQIALHSGSNIRLNRKEAVQLQNATVFLKVECRTDVESILILRIIHQNPGLQEQIKGELNCISSVC